MTIRERIGQIASITAAAGLLTGLVGLVWQGGSTPLIIGLLALGAGGMIAWVIATPDEARALLTGRQARFGTVTAFSLALLVGVVVMVYLLIAEQVLTLDMTQSNQFSLSTETRAILARFDRDVQITGFYSPREVTRRELDDVVYRLYEEASGGRIRRLYVDPQEQPALAQSFGVQFDAQVFVSYLNDDGTVDFSTVLPVARQSAEERDMTSALLRLLNTGEFTVAFNVGYSIFNPYDGTQQGYTRLFNALINSGIQAGIVDLREITEGGLALPLVDAVVLINMNEDLPTAAVAVLDEYLRRGGSLLVLADVTDLPFLAEGTVFNDYLWQNYGLRALDAVVVDYLSNDRSPLDLLSFAVSSGSGITERLNLTGQDDTRVRFSIARPIEIDRSPPVQNGFVIAASTSSYGERDIARLLSTNTFEYEEGVDIPVTEASGPLTVAAWADNTANRSRIIMIGDSDFLRNGQVASPAGNSILFLDSIAWLTGQGERLIFEPQARVTNIPLIFIAPSTLDQISFATLVLMPGTALALGFFIWLRRSRR